jgi:hypothetical protein
MVQKEISGPFFFSGPVFEAAWSKYFLAAVCQPPPTSCEMFMEHLPLIIARSRFHLWRSLSPVEILPQQPVWLGAYWSMRYGCASAAIALASALQSSNEIRAQA